MPTAPAATDGPNLGPAPAAVFAFDVGGTDLKAALIDASGTIKGLRRSRTPLDKRRPAEAVLDRVEDLAGQLSRDFPGMRPKAAGLVVPGLVDPHTGTGILSANLGWRDYPFAAEAERRLGLPVAFGHDVGSAGYAEVQLGAARGLSDVVVMILGTGIAGTVLTDGRVVTAGGYAGELGHALVPAPNGQASCILESVASAGAIARRYTQLSGNTVHGARAVLELSRAQDGIARQVWADAVNALAFSVAQFVSILGTEAIVIGGGLSEAGEELLAPLRLRVDELLTFQRRPLIMTSQLGQNGGLIGAALTARTLLAPLGLST